MLTDIEISHRAPEPKEYNALRVSAGLSPKDLEGARTGLQNSIFAVVLRDPSKQLIAMGRIVGDGGCFYQVVDIAVDPAYQGKGYGKLIMAELMGYLDNTAPKDSYVSLIADVPADGLYKQYGFEYTSPKSVGMFKRY
ncbi:GNAT family N-acetyltransferase [Paenibacillus sambharensis]|uniref:GNAT family N-acetyltransferase n=1 Tax=Paenibacillus sambharensis TaxID=1803190 RepID=A0A2W1LDS2_9BACL|nr:GNAT family N-acetyltransferase [Paenibacillus sambharensis]PZD96799.1 GNAT family N-acetyltransferase [Paenibacillus sambharensis]